MVVTAPIGYVLNTCFKPQNKIHFIYYFCCMRTTNKFTHFCSIFLLFSIYYALFSSFIAPHPFYVSVTEVKYTSKTKLLSVSCRVFANDLEDALKKTNNISIDILDKKNKAEVDKLINSYFKKRFIIYQKNKPLALQYVGFEQEEEGIWIYYKLDKCPPIKQAKVINSILYDFIPDQSNLIHFYVDENRKSNKLSNPAKEHSFIFYN